MKRRVRFPEYEPSDLFEGAHWRLKPVGEMGQLAMEVLVPSDWPEEKQQAVSDYYKASVKKQIESMERRLIDNERV